jgi:hypothetical protein
MIVFEVVMHWTNKYSTKVLETKKYVCNHTKPTCVKNSHLMGGQLTN